MLCVLQPTEFEEKAVQKVDDLLESYMGIRDTELGEWQHSLCFLRLQELSRLTVNNMGGSGFV